MKYMGSKSRIAKHIVPIIQDCIDSNQVHTYIEPFVGGCNIIDKIRCDNKLGFDKNKYLISLFNHLTSGGALLPEVPRDLYSEVRASYKDGRYDDWYVGNVGFLASYNGRWFDGGYAQSGYEKVKDKYRYRDYYQEAKANIESQIPKLLDAELSVLDYEDLIPETGSMVYCDPPYEGVKKYANSTDFDYKKFWDTVRKWSEDCYVLVSELNAPDDFVCVWEKPVSRSIKSVDKSVAVEKIFTFGNGLYARKCQKQSDAE